MKSFILKGAATLVAALAWNAHAAEFDPALFAKANQNAQSTEGKAYDEKLLKGLNLQPKFMEGVKACMKAHPGQHQVTGYILIPADAKYQVQLTPKSPFAVCLSKAMVGFRVPKPPELPWVNLFQFNNGPKPEATVRAPEAEAKKKAE